MFAEAEKDVRARVRVDDRLKSDLGLVHLERRRRPVGAIARGAEEISVYADVRIEDLGGRGRGAAQTHCREPVRQKGPAVALSVSGLPPPGS